MAAQVYKVSTERKLWPRIWVKNQPRAIETGDLHVTWPGKTKEFNTKNPLNFPKKMQQSQPLPIRSKKFRNIFLFPEKKNSDIHLHDCYVMFWRWLSMNSKHKQKNKLKFWPVFNFKAPFGSVFMKIFSLAQREMHFGLQNFIIQALCQC